MLACMSEQRPPTVTTIAELCARYQALLFDAYGVLVDGQGAIDGAAACIDALNRAHKPYLVVTNDASKSPQNASRKYRSLGLQIAPEQIFSSGLVLQSYFAERALKGARCVVLGTGDSCWYVEQAGGVITELCVDRAPDVVVICDEGGFDFLPTMDELLSTLLLAHDRGQRFELLLANPDLIYPCGAGQFGFTAGSVALMLQSALELRITRNCPQFVALGKPSRRIFDNACARLNTRDVVMIGDQIQTDIVGAKSASIASALTFTGVTSAARLSEASTQPDYVLHRL